MDRGTQGVRLGDGIETCHLAAVVGYIGAKWERPRRFFYESVILGPQLME
jgi:hypothetical protein